LSVPYGCCGSVGGAAYKRGTSVATALAQAMYSADDGRSVIMLRRRRCRSPKFPRQPNRSRVNGRTGTGSGWLPLTRAVHAADAAADAWVLPWKRIIIIIVLRQCNNDDIK